MKLGSPERISLLMRQAARAQERLTALQLDSDKYQGQRDFPALLMKAEEALATAEILVLLARERETMWQLASEISNPEIVRSPALEAAIQAVVKSSRA